MATPPTRWRLVRRLLAWGAVLLLAVGFIVPALTPATESWSGRAELQIEVRVEDSESGRPIPGVEVRVLDADGEEVHSGVTNANGEQQFSARRRTGGSSGPKGTFASISFPDWRLTASGSGYRAVDPILIANQRQPDRPEGVAPWVMPVTIPLQRLAEAAATSPNLP